MFIVKTLFQKKKPVRPERHKSHIHSRAANDVPLTAETNTRRRKKIWFDDHKIWKSDDWKGDRGSTVVKALCYKSEGRWFYPS